MNTAFDDELSVCFWNILYDIEPASLIRPQSERLPYITKALDGLLPDKTFIGISESENRNGQLIAESLGYDTAYFVENGIPNAHIGLMSRLKLAPRFIQLDGNRRAVFVKYGDITIVVIHLTFGVFVERLHRQQIRTLLKNLDTNSPVVIMGDFNSQAWQRSRKLLSDAGFKSALGRTFFRWVPTAPSRSYRHFYPEPFKTLGLLGFTIDDIYVKGIEVLDSGTFEGESDHLGVWAKLRAPHPKS
ncbi:MAG: endonuclease/exonuclease/phosphatase family protein [Candidatus Saccharimonadales bacterium]